MKQLKYEEFQTMSGVWGIVCPSAVGKTENQWWYQARLRNIELTDFVLLLKEKYKVDYISFDGKTLLYFWAKENQALAHRFILDTNKICRDKKLMI